jgi:hypothetical protein
VRARASAERRKREPPAKVTIRACKYALTIDARAQTIIDTIFAKATTDESASTVATEFREAYERGEWTVAILTAAVERASKADA